MASKQVSSIQSRSRGLALPAKAGSIITRLSSTRDAIVPGARISKLSTLALAALPSPCAHISVNNAGNHRDEWRLVYTAPLDSMVKVVPTAELPKWKITQDEADAGSGKITESEHACFVPWVPYKNVPSVHPQTVCKLPPPAYYRFAWKLAFQSGRTVLSDQQLEAYLKSQWTSLYNWCILKRKYTNVETDRALGKCVLDLYIKSCYQSNDATYQVYLDMSWGDKSSNIDIWRPKLGLTRQPSLDIVNRINSALQPYAQVVDLWQKYSIIRPKETSPETRFPLQTYQAVVIILESACLSESQSVATPQSHQAKAEAARQACIKRISERLHLQLSPDCVTTLQWPQRI